jgi:CRP-like cAMP-binding protein
MADSERRNDHVAPLLRKLRARDIVTDHEEAVLRGAITDVLELPAGRTLTRSGQSLTHSTLLVEGVVARYFDLAEGQRQIVELHVAGDFVDLHGFLLKRLEHHVGALTRVTVALAPHEAIRRITEEEPHLARLLWFSTLIDSAVQRERIVSIGRRTALARVAHLICEMNVRLEVVGLARAGTYALPITQLDLADSTGLTAVHVNRMLRRLREEGLVTYRGGEVQIQAWEQLQRAADFSPDFLYLERRPR